MTVGTLASVFERIDAIENRFGRSTPPRTSSPQLSSAPADGFGAILGEQDALTAPVSPDMHSGGTTAAVRPSVYATPLAPGDMDIGALLGGLDRLASMGLLAPFAGTGGTDGYGAGTPMTDLDRLAAIGALPIGPAGHDPNGTAGGSSVATIAGPMPAHDHSHDHAHAGVSAATPFAAEFERAGLRHGVPPRLLAAVGWVESRYQIDAVSPDGAIGVMQIMPMTAQELGVDPHDPVDAIDGAARLLALHQRRFGSWDLALAAYHSGGGAVSRNGNQAPPRAAAYVERIHDRLENS